MRRLRTDSSQSPDNHNSTSKISSSNVLRSKTVNNNNNNTRPLPHQQLSSVGMKAQISTNIQRPPNSASSENAVTESVNPNNNNNNNNTMLPSAVSAEIQRIGAVLARCDDKLANAATWERRHEALCRARDLFSHPAHQRDLGRCADFISVVGGALRDGLCAQLLDIRSQISREGCAVVDAMVSCAAGALGVCEAVADWFLPTLFAMCCNSAAVVSSAAADTLRKIFVRGRLNRDCLTSIYRACGDKGSAVRAEAFLALLMAMHFCVDRQLLLKQLNSIASSLRVGLSDKLPSARLRARVACWALDALSHEAAVTLLAGCDMSVKKQVLDEEPTYSVWMQRGTDVLHFSVEDAVAARKHLPQQQSSLADQQQQQQQRLRVQSAPPPGTAGTNTTAAATTAAVSASVRNVSFGVKDRPATDAMASSTATTTTCKERQPQQPSSSSSSALRQNQQPASAGTSARNRGNTVAIMQDIFATPAMAFAFSPSRQRAALLLQQQQQQQQQQDHDADNDDDAHPKHQWQQQQQHQQPSFSKWQELTNDYADSDWKHRIQVLGQIEHTVLGDDKPTAASSAAGVVLFRRDSVTADDRKSLPKQQQQQQHQQQQQGKALQPGSGSYTVEPGGSLLALAEVLYDRQKGGNILATSPGRSAAEAQAAASALGTLPPFFRRGESNTANNNNNNSSSSAGGAAATPNDVLHLVLTGVEDVNPKVSVAGMQSLQRILDRSPIVVAACSTLHLERLFKTMLLKLGDIKEAVRSKAVDVLTLIRKRIGAEKVVPILLSKILDLVQHRIRLACIEYLHAGIPYFDAHFQSSNNMRGAISKIIAFASRVHTQEISRAAVSCLARLVERHRELFVASLMALDLKEQTRVVEALHVAVPYLQQDIRRKQSREPLLLQSAPDTALTYSLFVSPDANKMLQQFCDPNSKRNNNNNNSKDGAAAAAASSSSLSTNAAILSGGGVPTAAKNRATSSSRQRSASPGNFQNKFPLPPGLSGDSAASPVSSPTKNSSSSNIEGVTSFSPRARHHPPSGAAAADKAMQYDSRNYQPAFSSGAAAAPVTSSRGGSPSSRTKKPSAAGGKAASYFAADSNASQQSSRQQQQQQHPESWFVRHQNNPPKSQVEQWAADRRDPPAMVALASAVTSDDKLRALRDLCESDASVWLDNFHRIAPFPIALCSDETDHNVRAAAVRCTTLLMTAPALTLLSAADSRAGTLEAAVKAVGHCLEDAFPDVRAEAATTLAIAFGATNKNSNSSAPRFACLKAVIAFCHELLAKNGTTAMPYPAGVATGPATGTLPFMLKHVAGLFLRGYSSSTSSSFSLSAAAAAAAAATPEAASATAPLLPDLCKMLTLAFSHDSPDVRKIVVTAIVELLMGMQQRSDEQQETNGMYQLLSNLTSLTSAQMRLVDIYWNRALREQQLSSAMMAMSFGQQQQQQQQQPLPMLELGQKMAQMGLSRKIGM